MMQAMEEEEEEAMVSFESLVLNSELTLPFVGGGHVRRGYAGIIKVVTANNNVDTHFLYNNFPTLVNSSIGGGYGNQGGYGQV